MVKRFAMWVLALCFLGGTARTPAQSIPPVWGANPHEGGATFRVWAPGATSVCVAGTFNGWNTTAHPLALESATSGVWSADVPGALTNHGYKYVVNGSLWRSDPRSRIIDSAHNDNSVIAPTNVFAWDGERIGITNAPDLVIYEAHVGTFPGAGGTFAAFGRRLGQLEELGATAVELMPINEFPTATSWGYNPTYPFAVERGYGTPEALKDFVQTAHGHGLAVLVDVVHNHWDGGSSLWAFDGTSPGPYFYGSDPYTYTAWGPRPDYGPQRCANTSTTPFAPGWTTTTSMASAGMRRNTSSTRPTACSFPTACGWSTTCWPGWRRTAPAFGTSRRTRRRSADSTSTGI